jgi:hypothetical protein
MVDQMPQKTEDLPMKLVMFNNHLVESLVGGLEHGFDFPCHIWYIILPIDELIFFKMVIAPASSLGYLRSIAEFGHFWWLDAGVLQMGIPNRSAADEQEML